MQRATKRKNNVTKPLGNRGNQRGKEKKRRRKAHRAKEHQPRKYAKKKENEKKTQKKKKNSKKKPYTTPPIENYLAVGQQQQEERYGKSIRDGTR